MQKFEFFLIISEHVRSLSNNSYFIFSYKIESYDYRVDSSIKYKGRM